MDIVTQQWDQIRVEFDEPSSVTGLTPTCAIQRISDAVWLQAGGTTWGAGYATHNIPEIDAVNLPGRYGFSVPTAALSHGAGRAGYRIRIDWDPGGGAQVRYQTIFPMRRGAWDDQRIDHTTAGTFGEGVKVASGGIASGSFAAGAVDASALGADAVAEVADAVWDEARAGHVAAGSFGEGVPLAPDALDADAVADSGAEEIADAIWEYLPASVGTAGAMGDLLRRVPGLVHRNARIVPSAWSGKGEITAAMVYLYGSKADLEADSDPWAGAAYSYEIAASYDGSGRLISFVQTEET